MTRVCHADRGVPVNLSNLTFSCLQLEVRQGMNCSCRGCMGHKTYTKSLELLVVVKVKLRTLNRGKGHEFAYKQDENHAQLQYSY